MKKNITISNFLVSTSHQKVLRFLSEHPNGEFYDAQIAREMDGLSKASVNNALRDLSVVGLIERRYMGNIALNKVDIDNPILKQFKIMINMSRVGYIVNRIKEECKEIIMFGACANGKNTIDAPLDLFIVTDNTKTVEKILANQTIYKELHLIIHTPRQVEMFKKEAPLFFESIKQGKKLL